MTETKFDWSQTVDVPMPVRTEKDGHTSVDNVVFKIPRFKIEENKVPLTGDDQNTLLARLVAEHKAKAAKPAVK
jgi:hypothetical protein